MSPSTPFVLSLVVGALLINIIKTLGAMAVTAHGHLWKDKGGVVSNGADDRFKI